MIPSVMPYCKGIACPIRDKCARYNPHIDVNKDSHFTFTPYDHERKRCEFLPQTIDPLIQEVLDKKDDE